MALDAIATEHLARRNVISSVFIAALLAIAFQEMVNPVRESIHAHGLTLGTGVLFIAFFGTSARFFIGNQLHLISHDLERLPGTIWLYDLVMIMIETTVLIFMGGVSSLEASLSGRVGFVGLLIALLLFDSAWVVSQWLIGRLSIRWQRPAIPWPWALLNTSTALLLLIPHAFGFGFYSQGMLIWLAVLGATAFIVDVVLTDAYELI